MAARKKPAEAKPDVEKTLKTGDITCTIKTKVKTLQDGQQAYWRGGQGHTTEWQTWPPGTFTAEQMARIEADERVLMETVNGD